MGDNAVKKIIKIIVPLILMLVCVTGAFAQGTLSEEILNQAKREAGLFLELKSALGLDWLDEYNAYLENPTDNPEPSWDLSVADLVSGGYLSDSFPSDFMITKSGQEVKISRIITSQAMKDVLPIYLPSVTIAGDVVSLIVQRPEQWVAWQAGLLGKVSRDGSDNPDILPNAVLDFGKGSEIRFINDDGKLTGIESLIYKTQELDDRFVNAGGDNMTGDLTIKGNKAWHAGNDGTGSGLDADLLDGKDSSHFTNASNLISGTVPTDRLTGTYKISISGNAATATNANHASSADNADTVDGKHASDFALSGHTHAYVSKAGDTMTGSLTIKGQNIYIDRPSTTGGYARGFAFRDTDGSALEAGIGMYGSGNNPPTTLYMGFGTSPWSSSAGLIVTPTNMTFLSNKVWHAGNDGTGSGLDADLLDGQQGSFYQNASNINAGTLNSARLSGTYGISITGNAATATTASNSDKLDGYHAGEFVKKSGDTATGPIYFQGGLSAEAQSKDNITTRTPSGFWQTNSATTGEGWPQTTNTWYHLLSSTHSNTGNYYAMQFAGNFFNSNDIYYRSTAGSGTTPWNKIWHSGNDGTGSGLDADLLDGQHGAFYQNASNLNAGTVPTGRLSGTYNISISGNAATATNADRLDGYHHDAFVKRAGDTMTGPLGVNFENGITSGIGSHNIKGTGSTDVVGKGFKINWDTDFGFVGLVDKGADRKDMVFANEQTGDNFVFMSQGIEIMALKPGSKTLEIDNKKVLTTGDYGHGKGIDADLLDGKHWSDIKSYIDSNSKAIVAQSLGTNGYVKFNTGLMIQWGRYRYSSGYAASITLNLPYPFPNACLWCNATLDSFHPGSERPSVGCYVVSKSQIKLNKGDVNGGWYWIAIGY